MPDVNAADLHARATMQGVSQVRNCTEKNIFLLGTDLHDTEVGRSDELFVIRSFAGPQAT